ncbi:MAG: Mth938-like domain-containing protein [Anaerolineae bacterium]
MIDSYEFGHIVIDGRSYTADVIILPDRVIGNWWRNEGHELCPADLWEVVQAEPELLIVGTGYSGRMEAPSETRDYLEGKGIDLRVERTAEACRVYNRLCGSRKTAAALHLTC